jgi:hypothetical protein
MLRMLNETRSRGKNKKKRIVLFQFWLWSGQSEFFKHRTKRSSLTVLTVYSKVKNFLKRKDRLCFLSKLKLANNSMSKVNLLYWKCFKFCKPNRKPLRKHPLSTAKSQAFKIKKSKYTRERWSTEIYSLLSKRISKTFRRSSTRSKKKVMKKSKRTRSLNRAS